MLYGYLIYSYIYIINFIFLCNLFFSIKLCTLWAIPGVNHLIFILNTKWYLCLFLYYNVINLLQVGDSGKVVGIDHIDELVSLADSNIRKSNTLGKLIDSERLKLVTGDGRKGFPEQGPYDAIHVGAASPQEPQAVCYSKSLLILKL